jgi:hypothetical protein
MNLPRPADLTSLVLRTDFTDDAAWDALRVQLDSLDEFPQATWVSDPAFAGVSLEALVEADQAAGEDDRILYVFLADSATFGALTDPAPGEDPTLLALDLADEPGRTFRVTLPHYAEVSANLSLANMDFADFADAADPTGVFRGFPS